MDFRKVGRGTALILLLLVSSLPAGARTERTGRSMEREAWTRVWSAVVEWVAKLGPEMDPNGAAAPDSTDGDGPAQGDRSELGPGMDPDGRT